MRNVKNSKEVLRQRSVYTAGKDSEVDRMGVTREGKHFAVTNVGNNGKLYLRCVEMLEVPV